MQRVVLVLMIAIGVASLIGGCGTAHYMLPGVPLEKKEWQVSVVWHYDFSRFSNLGRCVFPDVNAYVGAGNDFNLGFGSHFIPWPSHVSVAKYWPGDSDRCWSVYGHFGSGFQSNPSLEIGGTYSNDNGDVRHSFALAFSLGRQPWWAGPAAWFSDVKYKPSLVPVFKYSLVGRDAALSYNHYVLNSWKSLHAFRAQVTEHNDTLAVFGPGELVSIDSAGAGSDYGRYGGTIYRFIGSTGDTLTLTRRPPYGDEMPGGPRDRLEYWLGGELRLYKDGSGDVVQDVPQLIREWQETGEMVITRYSEAVLERIMATRSLITDASLGVAVYGKSRGN